MIVWRDCRIFLPMPVLVVVEDVGWWQGVDGSGSNQPFRNRLNRRHCLADYHALARFAEKMSMKIVLGMVMCEWDRTNVLKNLSSATWMGSAWDNAENQGPWLDEAAEYINSCSHLFEPALHAVGHEFWQRGIMERSEFHDTRCRLRDSAVVSQHLTAFATLWEQNHLGDRPKIFIPPALLHSFGDQTIQPMLKGFGIDAVITRLARARQYTRPGHPGLTWESGVVLLDRGEASVPWHQVGANPVWKGLQPILPFHWANLLHENPGRNLEVVDGWVDLLVTRLQGPEVVKARDARDCFCQAAACFLGRMDLEKQGVAIDLDRLPDIPLLHGEFWIKIQGDPTLEWQSRGAEILSSDREADRIQRLRLRPETGAKKIILSTMP